MRYTQVFSFAAKRHETTHLSRPASPTPFAMRGGRGGSNAWGQATTARHPGRQCPSKQEEARASSQNRVMWTKLNERVFFVFGEGLWGFVWSNGTQCLFFVVCKQQNLSRAGVHDVCLCAAAFLFIFVCYVCYTVAALASV